MLIILLDIHSHILPSVDDGAKNISESIKLLEMMANDGITDVLATPHFYADCDILEDYLNRVNNAFNMLKTVSEKNNLPNILLGSEILYYRHIGTTESIHKFCLNGSEFLLLELTDKCIGNELFEDILNLKNKMGITVIIAHLERYFKSRNFKKLLNFIKKEKILAQINASSLFSDIYSKPAIKLIKKGYINFIATDAHSPETRPPQMKMALEFISNKLGADYSSGFIRNAQILCEKITEDNNAK